MSLPPADGARVPGAGSQTDVVIDGIRRLIQSGELSAGARLPVEKDLAASLGVSRGSLREAMRALAILGVVEIRQGDGTYISSLDASLLLAPIKFLTDLQGPTESAHLLEVRRMLEPEGASRAALHLTDDDLVQLERILDGADATLDHADVTADVSVATDLAAFIEADSAFHRVIARASGNPALAALIEGLVGHTVRARLWRAINERGVVRQTQVEHRAILEALSRRDPDRARTRMAIHVLGVEDYVWDHAADPADQIFPDGNA